MTDTSAQPLDLIESIGVQTRLTDEEEQVLLRVLREAKTLATGPEGEAFEQEFSEFTGCADAVALSSCSAALEMAAMLTGLGPGDEVIIPSHTFVSSAVPFGRTGATIKWADIEANTCVIAAESVRSLTSNKTKVIVAVHLYGLPCDMDAIMAIANEGGIQVVEDCAQAPGARHHGRRVGSIGHYGCFSFHTQKNITTLGEGGMLTVSNKEQGRSARRLRWMGNWPFESPREKYWAPAMNNLVQPLPNCWPYNYCMGEPNAAVGRLLLKRLDDINQQRREQAARFLGHFANYPELNFQSLAADHEHVYHLMVARYDGQEYGKTRDDLISRLYDTYRLKTGVCYWPLNRTELFCNFGFERAEVPEADRFFDNMLNFPWRSQMGDEVIDDMAVRVCSALDDLRQG